ncbi:hypothetical protein AQUCO_01600441v1 [Aquilegia coerulea]|uniref:Uncharacterized protein n=1 Tax=Aquilegia coerulea TaxID=218851 RepID=A0A2G5DRN4_AQUCA|nr:hypothetical protein AQUCO_01600441v1 [Aquilegia coerulea]
MKLKIILQNKALMDSYTNTFKIVRNNLTTSKFIFSDLVKVMIMSLLVGRTCALPFEIMIMGMWSLLCFVNFKISSAVLFISNKI